MYSRLNPIIINEMRTRMRGRRAYILLSLYLISMSCIICTLYTSVLDSFNDGSDLYNLQTHNAQNSVEAGKAIFFSTTFLLLILVSHIAPAFTAASIAGEREQQTFDVLITTPLQARQIVWGKLGAVFLFLLLLIMTSLPIQGMAFIFGGVSLTEFLIATLSLLITALAFCALGLYISTFNNKTMVAIIATYSIVIPFIYGTPMLFSSITGITISFLALFTGGNAQAIALISQLVMIYGGGLLMSINPFSAGLMTAMVASEGYGYSFFTVQIDGMTIPLVSPWLIYVSFYILLTLLLVRLAAARLAKINS